MTTDLGPVRVTRKKKALDKMTKQLNKLNNTDLLFGETWFRYDELNMRIITY